MTKRVLTWVNTQRTRAGLDPLAQMPMGFQHHPEQCPMARALFDAFVEGPDEQLVAYPGGLEIVNGDDGWNVVRKIAIPKYVGAAITRFDAGNYPELIA